MATFTWTLIDTSTPAPTPSPAPPDGEGVSRGLLLGEDGDLDLGGGRLNFVRGSAATRQSLQSRLRLWLEEWFLDLDEGVDYRGAIFVKNPNPAAVRAAFRDRILGTVGVADLRKLELSFTPETRELSVSYEVTLDPSELENVSSIADTFTLGI